jgi:hypothetical protein
MSSALRLLLQLVDAEADSSYLLKNGLSYSQIAALFGEAMEKGLITHIDDLQNGRRFIVTTTGKALLSDSEGRAKYGVQGMWISPDDAHKCPQIGLNDVFLPKRKDSYF